MTGLRTAPRGRVGICLAVWIFALGVYTTTASPFLHGYDPQAADSVQAFVETGRFEMPKRPLYAAPSDPGRGGKRVSRIGLPQALFMVPFYEAGLVLDDTFPRAAGNEPFRALALGFYEPAVAATAAALFALILLRVRRSITWAVGGAVLFAVASIAWPYSKIGMETTVMLGMVIAVLGVVYARVDSIGPWLVAGFGAGMAVAAKAYELVAVAVILAAVLPVLRAAEPRRRLRLAAGLLIPGLLWAVAVGWYNWSRLGSPFDFGQADYAPTLAAPLNAVGFFISPGKGLLWYSPLALVGLLGLKQLAARNPLLARTIIGAVAAGTAVVAINTYWTDETWGPRYLVPVAWMLLIPIPFWATTRRRQTLLGAIATVAVVVQLVGVIAPYEAGVSVSKRVLGYDPIAATWGGPPAPLGHDVQRWIPQASPLLVQGALVTSWAATSLGLSPVQYSYQPYLGEAHSVRMTRSMVSGLQTPDFWWLPRHNGSLGAAAVLSALAALLAALALTRAVLADGKHLPEWMRRRVSRLPRRNASAAIADQSP